MAKPVAAPVCPFTDITLASVKLVDILEPFHVPEVTVPNLDVLVAIMFAVLTFADTARSPANAIVAFVLSFLLKTAISRARGEKLKWVCLNTIASEFVSSLISITKLDVAPTTSLYILA